MYSTTHTRYLYSMYPLLTTDFQNYVINRRITQLENTLTRLADSHEELLQFIKENHVNNSKADLSKECKDDVDNTDNIEAMKTAKRVYTPQEIVDMLCESSQAQRCVLAGKTRCKGTEASPSPPSNSTSNNVSNVSSRSQTPNFANFDDQGSDATVSDSSEGEQLNVQNKKRKLNISEYFKPLAVHNSSNTTDTGQSKVGFMRGGNKMSKYLTMHAYIRHRNEMDSKTKRLFVNRPPADDQHWWLAIKLVNHNHRPKELKKWYRSLSEAEMARDMFLRANNCKLIVNENRYWQVVPL